MRIPLLSAFLVLAASCLNLLAEPHLLDGTKVVLEGRWNALAKESGQILCATEPKIVDVVEIGEHAVPEHNQFIRVSAVLHWRGMTEKQKKWVKEHAVQGVPNGYIIHWQEASWQTIEAKPEANKQPEETPGKSPSSNPSQVPGAPHP